MATETTKITYVEGAAASTPAASRVVQYAKADGLFYSKDDAGVETLMSSGAGGAPSTLDYLVGTATGSLSAEIVVGTSPGGELGGTWASPTVDSTHSGSAHQIELDYVPITTTVTISATTEGTANTLITGTSQAYTAVPTLIEVFCPRLNNASTVVVLLYDGATVLGRLGLVNYVGITTFHAAYRLTPTAATHQYIAKAYNTSGSSGFECGAGGSATELPAFLRITRV